MTATTTRALTFPGFAFLLAYLTANTVPSTFAACDKLCKNATLNKDCTYIGMGNGSLRMFPDCLYCNKDFSWVTSCTGPNPDLKCKPYIDKEGRKQQYKICVITQVACTCDTGVTYVESNNYSDAGKWVDDSGWHTCDGKPPS